MRHYKNYDDWKLSNPKDDDGDWGKERDICSVCHKEIYGQIYANKDDGKAICGSCYWLLGY